MIKDDERSKCKKKTDDDGSGGVDTYIRPHIVEKCEIMGDKSSQEVINGGEKFIRKIIEIEKIREKNKKEVQAEQDQSRIKQ